MRGVGVNISGFSEGFIRLLTSWTFWISGELLYFNPLMSTLWKQKTKKKMWIKQNLN